MKTTEAYNLLKDYMDKPVFVVRIGICSPQAVNVTFEAALEEFDRCASFTTEWQEYVFIEVVDYVKDAELLDQALRLFNLGPGRHSLHVYPGDPQ